jgi:hypothetical protein
METVYIDDMWKTDEKDGSILFVSCSTEYGADFILKLNMTDMGIDWEGEFEDELYKDIQSAYDKCLMKLGMIDVKYITQLVENNYYGMI